MPTVTLREFTGANAATMSGPIAGVALMSADVASDDPSGYPVSPGSNSMEKWLAVSIDAADGTSFSNFSIEVTGDLPDGVTIRVGVADAGSTPTSATSQVAKTTLAAGRRFIWDVNTYSADGDRTRYLVLQEAVAATAATGAIPQQVLSFGYAVG